MYWRQSKAGLARCLPPCLIALVVLAPLLAPPNAGAREKGAELPIVKQALRNNCETAALSMLLVARGVHVSQLILQRELPRSGPLDPLRLRDGSLKWGDPDQGFVGRAAGGGTYGGYGVYTAPIKALAARHGVALTTLNRRDPSLIYKSLAAGRPVMVWVGLSNGPYLRWRTPEGKWIVANFGEHTVVLSALSGQNLLVDDPLSGRRLTWSRTAFEAMWARLGSRALAV